MAPNLVDFPLYHIKHIDQLNMRLTEGFRVKFGVVKNLSDYNSDFQFFFFFTFYIRVTQQYRIYADLRRSTSILSFLIFFKIGVVFSISISFYVDFFCKFNTHLNITKIWPVSCQNQLCEFGAPCKYNHTYIYIYTDIEAFENSYFEILCQAMMASTRKGNNNKLLSLC